MIAVDVCSLVIIAVLVIPATPLKKLDQVDESQNASKRMMGREMEFFAGGEFPANTPNLYIGLADTDVVVPQRIRDDPTKTIYFVSVFDAVRNIPFFSAYKVTSEQAAKIGSYDRDKYSWRNPNFGNQEIPLKEAYKKAIEAYASLQRGHMNPSGINSFSEQFMEATFTFTNAAPIFSATDTVPWQTYESRIRKYAKDICGQKTGGGDLYLLTGTSDYGIKKDLQGNILRDTSKNSVFGKPQEFSVSSSKVKVKLQIPRAIWTAGCCVWNETNQFVEKAESFAVMGNNERDEKNLLVTEMRLSKLEELLTGKGGENVNLFPGKPQCMQPTNLPTLKN